VDEVFFGNARQAGGGPNVARQIAVRSGLPESVTATTINMACGSGLQSLILGAESIRSGRNRVVLVGGTESMSGVPHFLPRMRQGYRLGHAEVVDGMTRDGFHCPLADMKMGETAEHLARELSIPRSAQDEFALESQRRCGVAVHEGRFAEELSAVEVTTRKGTLVVEADEHPRPQTTPAALAKLAPVFDPESGSVTAGNSSGITDGASAILLVERELARELGLEPLALVGESRAAGVDPRVMGIGPVPAIRALESANGIRVGDYDLIELNEAFAAQVLACDRHLDLPMDRVNVNGGSIALGHPIGATGARIVATLLHELRRREGRHGLATLCISGGMGLACAFHRDAD
jgi:acetyl-CoA C-acetyltransferase